MDCKFCKIIEGDRRGEEVIYESESFIVLTDRYRKTSAGAICLLLSKAHIENLLQMPDQQGEELLRIVKMVSNAMKAAYNCKGLRVWSAVGKAVGQSVFHCHIHLVPCNSIKDRFIAAVPGAYDKVRAVTKLGRRHLSSEENSLLAERIRQELTAHKVYLSSL